MLAGLRFVGLYSDLTVPDSSVLDAALGTIAAAGPHTRMALNPVPGKRLWSQRPAFPLTVQQIPDAVAAGDSASIMQYVRRQPGTHRPLEVFASQRHLAFDIDHGLGGGHFVVELVRALYDLSSGHRSPWLESDDATLALPRALVRTFGLHPARALSAWRCATALRAANVAANLPAAAGESVSWSPSPAVTIAYLGGEAEAAVNHWRLAHVEKPSSAALWLYIVRHALRAAGLPMTDSVVMAFDCRRYLPKGHTASSNFMIGLEFPFASDQSVTGLITLLRGFRDSALPLAQLGMASGRAVLRAGRKPNLPNGTTSGVQAALMYSDMGHISALDDLPWRGSGERSLTGLLDPATPNGVTVYCSRIGEARRVSMSFHDNVFERHVFDKAAEYLRDPVRLLSAHPTKLPG